MSSAGSWVPCLVAGICGKSFGQLANERERERTRRECCRLMEFNRIDEHQLIMPQTQMTSHTALPPRARLIACSLIPAMPQPNPNRRPLSPHITHTTRTAREKSNCQLKTEPEHRTSSDEQLQHNRKQPAQVNHL